MQILPYINSMSMSEGVLIQSSVGDGKAKVEVAILYVILWKV